MRDSRKTSLVGRFTRFLRRLFRGPRRRPVQPRSKIARCNLEALNRERRKHGLGELRFHDGYAALCRGHSRTMAGAGRIFHGDNPERIHCSCAGENVAMMPTGRVTDSRNRISSERDVALALHRGWMNSPGHRRNMLDPKFQQVGIGVHRRGNRYYATQLFSS